MASGGSAAAAGTIRQSDYWLVGEHTGALKGAAVSAVDWVGPRALFVSGDDNGTLGVWKTAAVGGGEDAHGDADVFEVSGPAVKAEERPEADRLFAQTLAQHASAERLRAYSDDAKRVLLDGHRAALPEGSPEPATLSGTELTELLLKVPAALPLAEEAVHVVKREAGGRIHFTLTTPSHENRCAILAALSHADVVRKLDLTQAAPKAAGTKATTRLLKCVSSNKEHAPRMKVTAVASATTGELVFSASVDGTVKVWELRKGDAGLRLVATLLAGHPVYAAACAARGDLLALTCGASVCVVDVARLANVAAGAAADAPLLRRQGHKRPVELSNLQGCRTLRAPHLVAVAAAAAAGGIGHGGAAAGSGPEAQYCVKTVRVAVSEDGRRVSAALRVGQKKSCVLHVATWTLRDASGEESGPEADELPRVVVVPRVSQAVALQYRANRLFLTTAEGFVYGERADAPADARLVSAPSFTEVFEQAASAQLRITAAAMHPNGSVGVVSLANAATHLVSLRGGRTAPPPPCTAAQLRIPLVTCAAVSRRGDHTVLGSKDGSLHVLTHSAAPSDDLGVDAGAAPVLPQAANGLGALGALGGPGDLDGTQALLSQEFPELTQFDEDVLENRAPKMTGVGPMLNRAESQMESGFLDSSAVGGVGGGAAGAGRVGGGAGGFLDRADSDFLPPPPPAKRLKEDE